MKEFKVGDKVYFPALGGNIVELRENESGFAAYTLIAERCGQYRSMDTLGRERSVDAVPSIFHATPENHELLEKLYGVEFEKPPTKPTGNEIVQAMLARGDKYVPCWLSDGHQCPNSAQEIDFVTAIADDLSYVTTVTGFEWNYATPFDPKTGEPITELPE